MKVLVLGGDGYLGWPTAMHFSAAGYDVAVVDSFMKREMEAECGVQPLWLIPLLQKRVALWKEVSGKEMKVYIGDIAKDEGFLHKVLDSFRPNAIIHYAEQPSAPYSMASQRQAVSTQVNNVVGTLNLLWAMKEVCPNAHLVKLGTMGEYGTPNIRIEEGWIEIEHLGRKDRMLYPKRAGSWYHQSKVHDSHNIEFACRVWKLRATDLNQGVVYGFSTKETELHPDLCTSFHYDSVFGTALNRFCAQAASGVPLTIYGKGGQTRGYLNIKDTLQCVEISVDNPAEPGEFRVFNQFTEVFSVSKLANEVVNAALNLGWEKPKIAHLANPRIEAETHTYDVSNDSLIRLGLDPNFLSAELLNSMLVKIRVAEGSVDRHVIHPTIRWGRENSSFQI